MIGAAKCLRDISIRYPLGRKKQREHAMSSTSWKIKNSSRSKLCFRLRGLIVPILATFMCVFHSSLQASDKTLQQVLCSFYDNVYEGANKTIASIEAEGPPDNSAPRGTNRHLMVLNERILQLMVIQQMLAHGCQIPKTTSSGDGYFKDAFECETERIRGNIGAPACDQNNWKSIFDDLEHFQ